MTKRCKGRCSRRCSRRTVQNKKLISDQVSACTLKGDKKYKFQKKSIAGRLACRLKEEEEEEEEVQSRSQDRSNSGSCSTEKRTCTVSVNQWAANGEKQDEERYIRSVFGTLVTNRARCFEHLFAFF